MILSSKEYFLLTIRKATRSIFEDILVIKDRESKLEDRMKRYLDRKGQPREYKIDELGEKYFLLDWVACNIIFDRPINTKQLLLYGQPCTQKTLIFHMFSRVVNIYWANPIRNYFRLYYRRP